MPSISSDVVCEQNLAVSLCGPSAVRVGGLSGPLSSLPADAPREVTCQFFLPQDVERPTVKCRVDEEEGSVECDVPGTPSTHRFGADGLRFRANVADIHQTPLLHVKYLPQVVVGREDDVDENKIQLHHLPGEQLNDMRSSSHNQSTNIHQRLLRRISGVTRPPRSAGIRVSLVHQCLAEMCGTLLIVVFGVGSVCSAVLTGYNNGGLWPVAVVWGFGVALAIAATASVSGAHLNPAVSLAFALFRPEEFPFYKLLPYWLAQYTGAILGGAFNLVVYGRQFRYYEATHGIIRGSAESIITASAFGEYFPNPGFAHQIGSDVMTPLFAMFVEAWGTGILMFVILALTDRRQKMIVSSELVPLYIGFTVAVLISLYSPLTQAAWNPARDFGPRLVAALAGWGRIAIPGPKNGFWIYIVGPQLGAPLGALVYDLAVSRGLGRQ